MLLRKFFKIISSRMFILGILLLVQLLFILSTIIFLNDNYLFISICSTLLSVVLVLLLINNQEQNPSTKLAWIITIMLFPIVGAAIYIMFGSRYASYGLRKKVLREVDRSIGVMPNKSDIIRELEDGDPAAASQCKYLLRVSDIPPFAAEETKYYTSGEELFPDLLAELDKAEKYIFIESFIISEGIFWGSVLSRLAAKAKAGVDVRVLFDDIGCINTLPLNYKQRLNALGIKCTVFNPIKVSLDTGMNNRDHRKIIIIDGKTGFIGGINLADEYINRKERFGYWKDSATLIRGESVYALCVIFLQSWNLYNPKQRLEYADYYEAPAPTPAKSERPHPGYIQPFHDNPFDGEHVGESVFMNMINAANRYIYINTPYFIVDNELLMTLTLAAKRGVDVRICTPHIPDKWYVHIMTQAYYYPLLKAGIKVMEFKPGFNHTKSIVADDKFAFVGTINCDYRSFYHHFECGAVLYGTETIADIKADFLKTEKQCVPAAEASSHMPLLLRFIRSLLRLFAPLM